MKKSLIFFLLINFFFSTGIANAREKNTDEILISYLNQENEFTKTSKYKISAIDPTFRTNSAGKYFPGYRGENQLIIYTPKFGKETKTNEYGKEATVANSRVFGFNGANSSIPQNGFVISGHGEAKKWINQNIIEGALIKIDYATNTIESVITPQSYLYKASHRLNEVRKIVMNYKSSLPNYQYKSTEKYYNASRQNFEEAKYLISTGNYKDALKKVTSSLLLAENAFYSSVPAVRDEFHGIWLRPVEKNKSEIAKTLKRLEKAGIKNVFLETYYQGYTIYPSETMRKYGLTTQREEFQGWDPLRCWIQEAHKRKMKIHIWFQTFYVGNENVSRLPGHILYVYPEWANVQKKNALEDLPQPSNLEHNGYFLDPANHMVKKFLYSLVQEISSNYAIDGLNIDYIRYPQSLSRDFSGYMGSTWGYTEYARNEFKKQYGKDPFDLDARHNLWTKWVKYRQKKVSEFVSGIKSLLGNKRITTSAVIFPDKDTKITKLQNWQEWAQNYYVDAFTPLIMSSDEYRTGLSVREIQSITGGKVKIYPGLFEPFTSGTPMNLLNQIIAARNAGAPGVVIFDNAHLDDRFTEALSKRAFKN